MKPSLEELDQERLVRYDIDVEVDAVEKYNIRAVPTLILVDKDGVELERLTGVQTLNRLQELLDV
jgi:thioredoxin-like negative regulator of GroEL